MGTTGTEGGNPFFVEEMLKHLVDHGLLRRDGGRWVLEEGSLSSLEVPATIAVVLRNRIEKLSETAQEVARWLAVFRRPMPAELLRGLAVYNAEQLETALTELIDRQIVVAAAESRHDSY